MGGLVNGRYIVNSCECYMIPGKMTDAKSAGRPAKIGTVARNGRRSSIISPGHPGGPDRITFRNLFVDVD